MYREKATGKEVKGRISEKKIPEFSAETQKVHRAQRDIQHISSGHRYESRLLYITKLSIISYCDWKLNPNNIYLNIQSEKKDNRKKTLSFQDEGKRTTTTPNKIQRINKFRSEKKKKVGTYNTAINLQYQKTLFDINVLHSPIQR